MEHSAMIAVLALYRNDGYFWHYFIQPSLCFVLVSYTTFWINKEAVPARTATAVIGVLITINLNNSIQAVVPKIDYQTWLGRFL